VFIGLAAGVLVCQLRNSQSAKPREAKEAQAPISTPYNHFNLSVII